MSSIKDGNASESPSTRPPDRVAQEVHVSAGEPPSALPKQLTVNGVLLEGDLNRLSRVLSLRAGHPIQAEKVIPFFVSPLPGCRLGSLHFLERANGTLEIEGEVHTLKDVKIAAFRRIIQPYLDGPWPALIATGDGLEVHRETDRGKGLGTHITVGDLLFFREMGVSSFFVPVARWGGPFWPERGFDFADSETRRSKIQDFREFLISQEMPLSSEEDSRLEALEHAWELRRFTTEKGRPVGKEFLERYEATNWMSRFDLDPSYPGWRILRGALRKIGYDYLLPEEFGRP